MTMFSIAMKSLRSKWRDYLVLFVGLMVSAAIFYMFSAIALNKEFLLANSTTGIIVLVFTIGEFLLGLITFVYLNFANSFLLRLRQAEYGLMSMLGAKRKQIGMMLMQETLALGVISTVIGIVAGIALTSFSGQFLMDLLGLQLAHWTGFSFHAILVTLAFFVVLFFLNGLYNSARLSRQDTLTLLTADKQVKQPKRRKILDPLLGLIGLALLIGGYAMMPNVLSLGITGFILILIINVLGTFFFVSRSLKMLTYALRGSRFNGRGLRSFLNGQLMFRLPDYQRLLTVLSVIFGLALGAMSVGQGFYRALPEQAQSSQPYTAAYTTNADVKDLKNIKWQASYHYVKGADKVVYFDGDEINAHHIPTMIYDGVPNSTPKVKWMSGNEMIQNPEATTDTLIGLANQINGVQFDSKAVVLKNADELAEKGTVKSAELVKVADLHENETVLVKNAEREAKALDSTVQKLSGSYGFYALAKSYFGGFEFMGIFLGIGFLAMLASTLMFKVLSGVADDKRRYRILTMIGTSERQVTMTVAKDLGTLFFIPLIIGLLDVVFGLNMFKAILSDPYVGFVPSLIGILVLYLAYYFLTVVIYRRLIKA